MPKTISQTCNISVGLYENAKKHPEKIAIVLPKTGTKDNNLEYIQYNFEELLNEVEVMARVFELSGIQRGMRCVLMVPPSLEFFSAVFGMFKSGIVPILIDPGMGIKNLKVCLEEAQPDAFVGIPKAHLARKVLGWGKGNLKINLTLGKKILWDGYQLSQFKSKAEADPLKGISDTQADELAAILFTSGSTGVPKGVAYQHGQFAAQIKFLKETYDIQVGEVDLATFPPFALFDPTLGMTSVIPKMDPTKPAEVNPANIFDAIEKFNVTHMFGSPALLNRVSLGGEKEGVHLKSLKRVISAGAPVPYQVIKRMKSLMPEGTEIFTPYGATECLPIASVKSSDILSDYQFKTAQGQGVCVGNPVKGLNVHIIPISDDPIENWDDTAPLPQGEIGEIVVQGPNVTRSYFNRDASTQLAKIKGVSDTVYHRMGDIGYFDTEGHLWFCGRKAHRIILENQTLFTIQCEPIFNTHVKVFRTALVGIQKNNKTLPVLCVELEKGTNEKECDQIKLDLLDMASEFEHLKVIRKVLFHPSLPVDIRHNSKIFREKLSVWAQDKI